MRKYFRPSENCSRLVLTRLWLWPRSMNLLPDRLFLPTLSSTLGTQDEEPRIDSHLTYRLSVPGRLPGLPRRFCQARASIFPTHRGPLLSRTGFHSSPKCLAPFG